MNNTDIDDLLDSSQEIESQGELYLSPYEDGIDGRIKLLSYSGLLKLHSCPRKYQLSRLKATDDEMDPEAKSNQNTTFAFGHIVGDGLQAVMEGKSERDVIWRMFLGWHAELFDENEKQKKSFWLAVIAIQKFISLREQGFLDEYELLIFKGKPACELSFRIDLGDGFLFRGSVDAVLKHKITGEILVLEAKTSSAVNLNPTTFKNSSQAIGYSTVLDVIAPDITSYDVLYLVYLTKEMNFEPLRFPKTYLQRAQWIQELLLDVETIKMYERVGVYPMRGESCNEFYRDCEYLNQCTLSTEYITTPALKGACLDEKLYDVELSLNDLIEGQMKKVIPIMDSGLRIFEGDEIL